MAYLLLEQQLQVLREQQGDEPGTIESEAYVGVQRGMSSLFSMTGIPPTVRTLNGEVRKQDDLPYVGGVYSDVWIGYWLGDQKVRIGGLYVLLFVYLCTGCLEDYAWGGDTSGESTEGWTFYLIGTNH